MRVTVKIVKVKSGPPIDTLGNVILENVILTSFAGTRICGVVRFNVLPEPAGPVYVLFIRTLLRGRPVKYNLAYNDPETFDA
jgi:hypothetical protein